MADLILWSCLSASLLFCTYDVSSSITLDSKGWILSTLINTSTYGAEPDNLRARVEHIMMAWRRENTRYDG